MSYELHLVRRERGRDVLAAVRERLGRPIDAELNPGPLVPSREEEKQRLARALMRLNRSLRLVEFDYAKLAARNNIDEQEARRRYRHLELNSEDISAIQITLWDDAADLIFPHWHSGEQARSVLQQAWECLEHLQNWGSFVTYDPQLDRILDLNSDFEAVLEHFLAGGHSAYERAGDTVE